MARQIITADQVHQALARGSDQIVLEADAIVTDAARELAETKGVRHVRPADQGADNGGRGARAASSDSADTVSAASQPDRTEVRRAVIAALGGDAPDGLDAAITRAIGG